jgi:ACS family tartrate transporter-like MFS transporter
VPDRILSASRTEEPVLNPLANRARRRVALRLLPYLALLYIIAFLDRTNISTAALQMPRDLGFDDRVLGLGSGIFFAGYFLLEIPGSMIVEKWGARRWIARIMVTWGLVSIGMAFIHTEVQFYSLRFLLGLAEAGFFPGILVYLTHWFVHSDRSKSVAAFMSAIPLSFIIGSPISGWLLGVHWYGLSGWRWLFVLEGLPAVLFGVVTWFYLTDWPAQASWLPQSEREWLSGTIAAEASARKSIRTYTVWQAFRDWRVLLLTLAYFLHASIAYSFVFWLPTILKRLTSLPDFQVTLAVSFTFLGGLAAMLANGWHSDRSREHRWHTAIPMFLCSLCLLALLTLHPNTLSSAILLGLANASTLAFVTSFWAIPSAFLGESAGAACTGLINSIAMLGGFAGPSVIGALSARSHSFHSSFLCMMVVSLVAGATIVAVRVRPFTSAR